jgi:hypothetical protein
VGERRKPTKTRFREQQQDRQAVIWGYSLGKELKIRE